MEARTLIIRLAKSAYFRTPLWRFLLLIMKFDKNIAQLSFITEAIKSVKAVGAVLEIGVGGGGTSIVINKFMAEETINDHFTPLIHSTGSPKKTWTLKGKKEARWIGTSAIDLTVRTGT